MVKMTHINPRCATLVASSVTKCIRYKYKQVETIVAYTTLFNSLPFKKEKVKEKLITVKIHDHRHLGQLGLHNHLVMTGL